MAMATLGYFWCLPKTTPQAASLLRLELPKRSRSPISAGILQGLDLRTLLGTIHVTGRTVPSLDVTPQWLITDVPTSLLQLDGS